MNVRVNLNYTIYDGAEIVFKAPCDASVVTGLIVYYPNGTEEVSSVFSFADAHTNDLGHIDDLFYAGAVVKVILDTETNMAFVQNAPTNAYLEDRLASIPKKFEIVISYGEDGQWYADKNFDELLMRYSKGEFVPITIEIESDAFNHYYVTGIEPAERNKYMILHSGAGVFQWNSDGTIEKIADADNGGSVDLSNYYTKNESDSVYASKSYVHTEATRIAIQTVRSEVDTTLSISSKPADAKAVGDAIGNISSALDELHAYAEALKGGGAV